MACIVCSRMTKKALLTLQLIKVFRKTLVTLFSLQTLKKILFRCMEKKAAFKSQEMNVFIFWYINSLFQYIDILCGNPTLQLICLMQIEKPTIHPSLLECKSILLLRSYRIPEPFFKVECSLP